MCQYGKKLILAPMAGFSDQPFRRLAREFGADEVVTELISANALVRSNRKTFDMARIHEAERPASIQIFGSEPFIMAEAAAMVEKFHPLFIDLNMGCPAKKVTRNGAGAALLENPKLAEEIIKRVTGAVKTPVSVKIRTGKNASSLTGLEVAKRAAGNGVRRISVHARTVADGFSGPVNYDAVADLKKSLAVEIIGNGGIASPEDARLWLERTGCDGLMIGRGAIGHPSLFRAIRNGVSCPPVEERETALRHMEWMEEFYGAGRALGPMVGHLIYYSKGLPDARQFRRDIAATQSYADLREVVERSFNKAVEFAVC